MHSFIDLIFKEVALRTYSVYFILKSRIFTLIVHLSVFQISKKLRLIVTPLLVFSFCIFVRLESKVDLLQTDRTSQTALLLINISRFHASQNFLWDVS